MFGHESLQLARPHAPIGDAIIESGRVCGGVYLYWAKVGGETGVRTLFTSVFPDKYPTSYLLFLEVVT
jgi:hypothetical protein